MESIRPSETYACKKYEKIHADAYNERCPNSEYEEIIMRSKDHIIYVIDEIAATTGLPLDMLECAVKQLQKTTFGNPDHLAFALTSDDNGGALADYQAGSLRIEISTNGNGSGVASHTRAETNHIITHQLNHAASAQSNNGIMGLNINGQGLEANEGMTEYLTQLAIGIPGFERMQSGEFSVNKDVPYGGAVLTMLALHKQFQKGRNDHFATLFNSYYGCTQNLHQLEQALDSFYGLHDVIVNKKTAL